MGINIYKVNKKQGIPDFKFFIEKQTSFLRSLKFILALVFSLLISTVQSQILMGLKVGMNSSWATVDTRNINYTNTENINRLQFGLVYDHAISRQLAIRSELLYSEKGYAVRKYFDADQFDKKNSQNSSLWEFQTRYLEIPVMLKWFTESRKIKFYVNGGAYAAYWLSAKSTGSFFTPNLGDQYYGRKTGEEEYKFDSDYGANKRKDNRFDYGMVVGTGLAYKVYRGEFFVEGRYSHGLADRFIFEQSPKYYQPQMNRNWSISVGFLLTLQPQKIRKPKENIEEDEE